MRRALWLLPILMLAGCASRTSGIRWVTTVRWSAGDSASWSQPGFDDSRWDERAFWDVPHPRRTVWIRARVRIPRNGGANPVLVAGRPWAAAVTALASHELWWDGVQVGRAGIVGRTAAEETPGPVQAEYPIPDSLAAAGTHLLALRASAFHQHFTPTSDFLRLKVGPLGALAVERRASAWAALASLSGILLGTLLAFVMFFLNRRDRASLLLGLLGVAVAVLLGAEAWRPLAGYSYDRHIVRLVTICGLTWMVGALLGAFLVTRFPRRHAGRILLGYLVALWLPLVLARSWNGKPAGVDLAAFVFAAVWTALAARARRRGAFPALAGALIAIALLVYDLRAFLDRNFFFAVDALLACLLIGHLFEWRDALAARGQALTRSARLEAEMLKRHLQPHFVMNTLTAIGGWIEEDPATAVRMIDALADEFRMLTRIADRRLIPLADELRLCRAHLDTLELRRETIYRLETTGLDEADQVPPALLHTLIENAVTHGPGGRRKVTMRLEASRAGGRLRYVFTSARGDTKDAAGEPGTGTRYVVARLREAWGDDWTMTQEAVGDAWRVAIDMPGSGT